MVAVTLYTRLAPNNLSRPAHADGRGRARAAVLEARDGTRAGMTHTITLIPGDGIGPESPTR